MPFTRKDIKNAFGRFADKFRCRTKKPDNSNNRIKYSNTNEQVKNRHRINQYVELTNKLSGCKRNLPILVTQNAKQHDEINELKHIIQNYERIAADSDKLNRELQDELAQCQGSKSRKQGSSGRRSSRRSTKSGNKRSSQPPTHEITHKQHGDINYLTGQEMYDEYQRLTKMDSSKLTPYQKAFIDSITNLDRAILKRGFVTPSDHKRELLKVLNRWQSYNPSSRMPERFSVPPHNLLNNRPPAYIKYQSKMYADKTRNAFPNNGSNGWY